MGSHNTRVRQAAIKELFLNGPMTVDQLRDRLQTANPRNQASHTRIVSLLSRSKQFEDVGKAKVQTHRGWEHQTMYDVNRMLIHGEEDIYYTTPAAHQPKSVCAKMIQCPGCGMRRLIPPEMDHCLFCERGIRTM